MAIDFGIVKPGRTLCVPFDSFAGSTGASITLTGLAVTDIEIYKDGSVTQRSSDAGYTLLDTDGIDFDGLTGIHGFSINLADNTDAGFYAAGSRYFVVVSSVTVDSQTVSFVACTFSIGQPDAVLNTTIATLSTQTSFTLTVGPAEDDALNNCWLMIHDVASAVQMAIGIVSDYTGATKTVTLAAAPTFTIAATDNIAVMGPMPIQPTVAGRTLDVSSGGEAGVDWANVGSKTTTNDLSGTTIATTQKVDVETIKTNPVVNGGTITFPTTATLASTTNITAGTITTATNVTTVNGLASGVITAASIAADAITDAKVASDVTIASVTGAVGSVTAGVTVTTNNDKTGYGLSSAAVQAIWDALTSALTTVGSIGKLLVDNINATISSRATATAQTTAQNDLDILTGADGVTLATSQPNYAPATAAALATAQTSIDDLPTNAELATALAAADDAVLAAIAALNNLSSAGAQSAVTAALTAALTEGYRGTGATGSVRDLLYEIVAHLGESSITSTTKTLKKLDGSTTAKTYTLDSATTPTAITETT